MGRTTLVAQVNGSGAQLSNLDAKVNAAIRSITLKGYDYSNLTVNGAFIKKAANGHITTINDKNIKLDAQGSVDLNPELPVYNFTAKLDEARLHALKLIKDTITLSAQINSDFSGNSLNNIQGTLGITCVKVGRPAPRLWCRFRVHCSQWCSGQRSLDHA